MELKKNDRVIHGKRLGTVMGNSWRYHSKHESYIEVMLDEEEYSVDIKINDLRKVNTYETKNRFNKKDNEKILTENKLHNLDIYEDIASETMFDKLKEEVEEVEYEIIYRPTLDKDKLASELLDVMQVCMGIAYTQNINLEEHIEKHNQKLLSRGHKFI